MITMSSSGMYFCATRCTSAAVTAAIFSGRYPSSRRAARTP
jgi:hypothetical protein